MLHNCDNCERANYLYEPKGGAAFGASFGEYENETRATVVVFTEVRETADGPWRRVEQTGVKIEKGAFNCGQCGELQEAPKEPRPTTIKESPNGLFRVLVFLYQEKYEMRDEPDKFDGPDADDWANNIQKTEGGQWVAMED